MGHWFRTIEGFGPPKPEGRLVQGRAGGAATNYKRFGEGISNAPAPWVRARSKQQYIQQVYIVLVLPAGGCVVVRMIHDTSYRLRRYKLVWAGRGVSSPLTCAEITVSLDFNACFRHSIRVS